MHMDSLFPQVVLTHFYVEIMLLNDQFGNTFILNENFLLQLGFGI
jgi:hypothetical protein